MPLNTKYKKSRVIIVFALIAIAVCFLIYKFGVLAFTPVSEDPTPVPKIERGSILDRSGKPLAIPAKFFHLGTTLADIEGQEEKIAEILSPFLGKTEEEILNIFKNHPKGFFYLKKHIPESEHDEIALAIDENDIHGLKFDEIQGRVYPENKLASQVIGFMGEDEKGRTGIEYSQQNILSPDATPVGEAYKPGNNKGKNIYLTLDANLQYKLEKIAEKAMEETQAESLMLIAAEAKTGEILSYISLPSANLNEYPSATTEQQIDRPAILAYEPGSVFKIFSVASFIDAGVITEDERFVCDGRFEVKSPSGEKAVITCLDHHGSITAREALEYSCNDALAQMSQKIDSELFLDYIHKFGFGEKTGIELPGETRGSVKSTKDKFWSLRSKPTISIGQEISVSALQMVQAASAFANDGVPIRPTLISKITDYDGTVRYEHEVEYKEPAVSPETADYLRSCMKTTAQFGTGHRANIEDISIGVKTGTAQMLDPETGRYSDTDFVSNCVALFPIEDPEIILYIVINKAQGETYAGRIVAPVIGDAADVIIDHLGMARNNATSLIHSGVVTIEAEEQVKITDTVPDFTGTPKRMLTDLLMRNDIEVNIQGDGYVVSQYPAPGTPFTKGMLIELYLE